MSFLTIVLGCFLCLIAFGVLYAFAWAAKDGQMNDVNRGSLAIFDEEEAPGVMTDAFPDRKGVPAGREIVMPSGSGMERKTV